MQYASDLASAIGNTPLIKLRQASEETGCEILGKAEFLNPGQSVKDRAALSIIKNAINSGKLKPGGTIVEGTSGNTGMGLALGAIVKGYRLICVTTDKQSKEKVDILKAVGAEVIICPTNVEPDDENSYYSTSRRLSSEIENSWYVNQYDNLSNSEAHYLSTGPEIWEQMGGRIDHFVVGVGTGGTISGVGRFLKEKNNKIKIWGIDSFGSIFKKYHETGEFDKNEIYPYLTEGIGEDILPENVDFKIIDHFEKVTDENAAIYARRLAKKEGILAGYSCGAAIAGLHQLKSNFKKNENVVVLLHDSGTRYIGKVYNDEWMKKQGFKLD